MTSPYLRCMQTSTYMGQGLFRQAMSEDYTRDEMVDMVLKGEMVKPILFLTTNLSNCVSRRTQYFFDFGTVAKMHRKPDLFIKKHLDNQVASYHENKYGESVLFYPGQIENQKVFKFRIRQGIVDIIIEHFMQME